MRTGSRSPFIWKHRIQPFPPPPGTSLKNQVRFFSDSLVQFTLPSPRGFATLENIHSLTSRRFYIPWEKTHIRSSGRRSKLALRTGMLSALGRWPRIEQPAGEQPSEENLGEEASGFTGCIVLSSFRRESGEVERSPRNGAGPRAGNTEPTRAGHTEPTRAGHTEPTRTPHPDPSPTPPRAPRRLRPRSADAVDAARGGARGAPRPVPTPRGIRKAHGYLP